ncbi:hypothetical protein LMH87_004161 [Akanthomyces muscarius]|uniref:Uncharacterized protein n=1 Tax=Akanthomyces muscarius TaxID=2231603 RepID=A0A9W8UGS8_AKAMU|nr:hypothetical protein LMH87_004161 [Akanthomyces muscarius]KAJ4145306.1 hypothetical protein LMH87_004161 [Akanthomyces muscarius]
MPSVGAVPSFQAKRCSLPKARLPAGRTRWTKAEECPSSKHIHLWGRQTSINILSVSAFTRRDGQASITHRASKSSSTEMGEESTGLSPINPAGQPTYLPMREALRQPLHGYCYLQQLDEPPKHFLQKIGMCVYVENHAARNANSSCVVARICISVQLEFEQELLRRPV